MPLWKRVTLFVAGFIALCGTLAMFGGRESDYKQFIPDLIVGVLTAGAIGLVLAVVQNRFEIRRRHDDNVSVAYHAVLDSFTPLRHIDLRQAEGAALLGQLSTRLIQLAELVDAEYPAVPMWFEAERQLSLRRATLAIERVAALLADKEDYTADELLQAGSTYYEWVVDFGDRLRFWRTGRLSDNEIREVALKIRRQLEAKGAWRGEYAHRQRSQPPEPTA